LRSACRSAPAQAQLARTYVSAEIGDNGGDCNRLTPCKTFQVAHDKTFPNGEITVLDPGGYGAVTINRAISIINDGVGEAGVLVSGGLTASTISAAHRGRRLARLDHKGIGFGGGTESASTAANPLSVENCVIRNLDGGGLNGNGILFEPNVSSNSRCRTR